MLKNKNGASIISLALCAVAITLVTTALVLAQNNSEVYRAQMIERRQSQIVESSAYTRVYKLSEVRNMARQAFANNYLSFYDNEVDLEGFEALIIGELMQTIPQDQLEDFVFEVKPDGVNVEHK